MSDKITTETVRSDAPDRDENGDLIPTTHDVEWNDKTAELDVKPIVGGIANKIAKHETGLAELDPEAVAVVLRTACPGLDGLTSGDVESMRVEKIQALVGPIVDQLPEVEDAGGNPVEMERGERAREMR